MSPIARLLGRRVRVCRQLLGLTQQQLGDAVGCSKSHISQIEQGLALPSVPLLVSLSRHLHQRPGYFLEPDAEPDAEAIIAGFREEDIL